MSPESARRNMLQVARLVEQCAGDEQALTVAIAVLLRPEVIDRSDEQDAAETVATRIVDGLLRAIGLGDGLVPSSAYPPRQFWDQLAAGILKLMPWEAAEQCDDIPGYEFEGSLWSVEEDEAWNRLNENED